MAIAFYDHSGMPEAERELLEATLTQLNSLEKVLAWGRRQVPTVGVDEILTQDEYTHDVLVGFTKGRYLNFDTT